MAVERLVRWTRRQDAMKWRGPFSNPYARSCCAMKLCSAAALPAEGAYRAAVSDINRALQGKNVEAARAALRSFLGDIPVFQTGRQLAARLTMNAGALLRNPGNVLLVGSGGRI